MKTVEEIKEFLESEIRCIDLCEYNEDDEEFRIRQFCEYLLNFIEGKDEPEA